MAVQHNGNVQNQLLMEEHDGLQNAKRVSLVSAATIFAVVNTSAGGNVTVQQGTTPWVDSIPSGVTAYQGTSPWVSSILGNVTLSDSKSFIGLTTTTLGASPAFIGITTIANQPPLTAGAAYAGLMTIDIGTQNGVAVKGNVTLSDSKGFIGLTTTTLGASPAFVGIVTITNQPALVAGAAYIGLVTVDIGTQNGVAIKGNVTLSDSKGFIGLTTTTLGASPAFIGIVTVVQSSTSRSILGNLTLSDAKTFIGLVTVGGIGTVTLADPKGFIGLVTIGGIGTVTLADPKGFIGLVSVQGTVALLGNTTVLATNIGTNKTLIPLPILFSTGASVATIAVPTNKFKITSILLSSNATVRVNIKSGASYLTGNASLGINLNPGGGFVKMGSPDSPAYFGLANAAGLVIEKFDYSGVISQIGGDIIYFDEA